MKHIVSIGGGFSSTVLLPYYVIDKYGSENVDFIMCLVANESKDVWRLVDWLELTTGKTVIKLTYTKELNITETKLKGVVSRHYKENAQLADAISIWDLFRQQRILGNTRMDVCSRVLKRETFKKYVQDNYKPEETTIHLGITEDEIDRMLSIRKNWGQLGYSVAADLADDEVELPTKDDIAGCIGFMPEVYEWGLSHNNCGGFCIKAGKKHMKKLYDSNPELLLYHAKQEEQFKKDFESPYTIMRETINGVRVNLSLMDLYLRFKNDEEDTSTLPDETGCNFCDAMA